jgi:hypothetical protein
MFVKMDSRIAIAKREQNKSYKNKKVRTTKFYARVQNKEFGLVEEYYMSLYDDN